MFRLSRSAIIR